MLQIETIKTDLFDANCYLLYADRGDQAVVVDPGFGSAIRLKKRLEELSKSVGAVILSHGHPDHIWDADAVSKLGPGGQEVPVYLPSPDFDWLPNPLEKLGFPGVESLPVDWVEPKDVQDLPLDSWQVVPGVFVHMVPAPGHSPGSCILLVAGPARVDGADETVNLLALSADVIFAGGVGRTDLPGGDEYEMRQSLRTLAVAVDPDTVLLPGHGPATVWGEEIEQNPYVRRARGAK